MGVRSAFVVDVRSSLFVYMRRPCGLLCFFNSREYRIDTVSAVFVCVVREEYYRGWCRPVFFIPARMV